MLACLRAHDARFHLWYEVSSWYICVSLFPFRWVKVEFFSTQLQEDEDDYAFKVLSEAQFTSFAARRVDVTPEGKLALTKLVRREHHWGETVHNATFINPRECRWD